DGFGNFDLWMTTRSDPSDPLRWTPPVNLETINTTDHEWSPALSSDGLALYFISNRPGAPAGYTFAWVAKRASISGPFTDPVALITPFRRFQDMFDPCLSADGSTLIVASRGLLGSSSTSGFGPYWHLWQLPLIDPPKLSIS